MNDTKHRNPYIILLVLGLFTIVAGSASAYFYVQPSPVGSSGVTGGDELQSNTIIVSGSGTVTMPPDEAEVILGVQTQSNDAVTAQQNNALKMERIIEALQDIGIGKDDMETSSYQMYPVRDYDKIEQTITGYIVSNQLKVTVTDTEAVGDVIDIAVDAGANEVWGVSFTLSDQTRQDARDGALNNAVLAARSDADTLAEALDVSITGPISVSTGGGVITTPYPVAEAVALEKGIATPIQPGDVSVSANVQVIYKFE